MADQTFPYRVRAGQVLAHDGQVLEGGAVVSLSRRVAIEVRHLVEPIDASGQVIDPPTALQLELEARPAHEHADILQRRRGELVSWLRDLQEVSGRASAAAAAAQGEVDRVTAEIAVIDQQLTPPAEAPAPAPERTPKPSRATKSGAADSDDPPPAEAPAQ